MSEGLRIAICEDEIRERNKLIKLLDESTIENTYSVFSKGEELLDDFIQGKYDLILMDIYMGGELTGVETISLIRKMDGEVPVAFVTTSKEHALESYRLSAMKYIEKPYTKESIDDALHLALLKKQDVPSLIIHRNGIDERVPYKDILYIEQQGRKVFISLNKEEALTFYGKLSELSEQLPKNTYFAPHKSFVVNLAYVMYIDMELRCFIMADKTNIPIRRENLSKAKRTLEDFMYERTRRLMK